MTPEYDFVIIGSGFGGSASGLRLVEKGYRVLMLEKGRELKASDFPRTNWDLKRWMWAPAFGFRGIFKMTFFRHVTALTGVGVGGGSLGYASTHPTPKDAFFAEPDWAHLADWKQALAPHYATARAMLGVRTTPIVGASDEMLREVAAADGRPESYAPTDVAIYFGTPGEEVPDPYFGGAGPRRSGCTGCGGCMLGCRVGAKNTLDTNYLHLARRKGLELAADTEVVAVRPVEGGYAIEARQGPSLFFRRRVTYRARQVVFAGGVLGTIPLLLKLRDDPHGLPRLSPVLGRKIRTNSEALVGIISKRRDRDLSKGIAIGSAVELEDGAHLEAVRYSAGSGFFRLLVAPHVAGRSAIERVVNLVATVLRHPLRIARAMLVRDFAKQTAILLYMRTPEGTLRLQRAAFGGLKTARDEGEPPCASMPGATRVAHAAAKVLEGTPFSLLTETFFNIPTTAHILGGCPMGRTPEEGVIDDRHRLFGYEGLYVADGSVLSANPGVNPSLTILALTERMLTFIPQKEPNQEGGRAGAPA